MSRFKTKNIIVLFLFVAVSFTYVYGIAGISSGRTQSFHGLQHSAYVYQIVNGIVPPTNPDSIGAPAGLYWGWHALLALFVFLFNVTSFQALLFINSVALSVSLLCLWYLSGRISGRLLPQIAGLTWPFFILNPVRGVKEFILVAFDNTVVVDILKPWLLSKKYLFLIKGIVDSRPSDFIGKFLNFTSFPTAVCLVLLAYCSVACAFPRRPGVRFFVVAFLSFLVAFFHPVSVLALAVLLGVMMLDGLVASWTSGRLSKRAFFETVAPGFASAAGVLCALPYLLSLSSSFAEPVGFHLPLSAKELRYEGWALLPAIPLYAFTLFKVRTLKSEARVALASGIVFALLAMCMTLPDHNEYKFTFYFAIVTAMLVVEFLNRLCVYADSIRGTAARYCVKSLAGAIVVISFVSPVVIGRRNLTNEWARYDPYVYAGRYARLRETTGNEGVSDLQHALDWIHENTLPTDYILTLPEYPTQNQIPFLTGRRTVVNTESIFTGTIPYQNDLERAAKKAVQAIRDCAGCEEALRELEGIPAKWPDLLYALVESPAACPPERALSLVYQNPRYKVYKILFTEIGS